MTERAYFGVTTRTSVSDAAARDLLSSSASSASSATLRQLLAQLRAIDLGVCQTQGSARRSRSRWTSGGLFEELR
jgi:hypothetical protein